MGDAASTERRILSERPKVFEILEDIPGQAADEALLAGLPEVSPPVQNQIVRALLKRGTDAGLRGLPPLFFRLNEEAQSQIVAQSARMFTALRACVASSSPQTRQNTLDIVRRSGNPRLAYLATHAIHDGAQKIRAEAAITVLELVQKHISSRTETIRILHDTGESSPELMHTVFETMRIVADEHKFLLAALREAVEHYESHHRPEVIEAAMLLAPDLEKCLFDQATIKRGKLTHAMLELIGGELEPRFVPFVYVALCHPELRRRIVPKIAACRSIEFFAEFIRWHWLARDANIRKSLAYVRNVEWLEDGFEAAFNLPPDVAARMPSWLLALGLSSNQKVALLLNCLIVDNAAANRAAVWALVDIDTPASTVALESLLDHDNSAIKTIAKMEIARRRRTIRQAPRRSELRGRPPEWVAMLDRANLKEEFEDFWQNFEHIHPAQALAAGKHVLKYVTGFSTQLQLKLLSQNSADRFRAIRLAVALALCEHFQKDIFAAANDKTPEIRAASMTALGHIGGETSRRILERGISDASDAVQAAAINALDKMGAKRREELVLPRIESENADVRAAAVRCLLRLRVPASANALVQMLHDPRPDHRCAALWIADQLKLAALAQRIQNLAQSDPDPRISRVAMHVVKRLQKDDGAKPGPGPAPAKTATTASPEAADDKVSA